MAQTSKYEQLRPEDRVAIAGLRLQGKGVRETARAIGRSPATVSRELRRNADAQGGYVSQHAMLLHAQRRKAARPPRKLTLDGVNWRVVTTLRERPAAPPRRRRTAPERPAYEPSRGRQRCGSSSLSRWLGCEWILCSTSRR